MEELGHLVEGNLVHLVVKIRMGRTGHDEEFLIIPFKALEGIFTEVAGMGFFAMGSTLSCVERKSIAAEKSSVLMSEDAT